MALPIGDPKCDVVISYTVKFSSTNSSIKKTFIRRRDKLRIKNMKKTETSIEQSSLYKYLFGAPSVRNRKGDK